MSKKSKVKRRQSPMESFARQVTAKHADLKLKINVKGEISMSDAITQIIAPYKNDAPSYDAFSKLVGLACIAWNTSLLPLEKQLEALNKMLKIFDDPDVQRDMLTLLLTLMARKEKLFPHISRMIVEHRVTDQGRDFHIAIASTVEQAHAKK